VHSTHAQKEPQKLLLSEAAFLRLAFVLRPCARPRESLASAAIALAEGYATGLELMGEGVARWHVSCYVDATVARLCGFAGKQ